MALFNAKQTEQLLKPVHPSRVLKANGMSHLSQQDVVAHLIRLFGFGGFQYEMVHKPELVFEEEKEGRWTVCYQATMRLTVQASDSWDHRTAVYEDGSTGDAVNQPSRAAAHDLALKSAISTAKKRCAIHLGDQFGLSLYNKGQTSALVKGTLVMPEGDKETIKTADGKDVREISLPEPGLTDEQRQMLSESLGAEEIELRDRAGDGDGGLHESEYAE